MITFEKVTPAHIQYVADNMRQADAVEVWASSNATPLEALEKSLELSDYATTVCADGHPLVIMGLVKGGMLGTGVPWLLGTDDALKYKRHFLTESRQVVQEMLDICPHLYNHVHDKNYVSVRWLKWLGFMMDDPAPHGPNGELFHRFYMRKEDV